MNGLIQAVLSWLRSIFAPDVPGRTEPEVSGNGEATPADLTGASGAVVVGGSGVEYNTTEDPAKNRWLLLRDGVKRTTKTDPVIARLDEYFFLSHLVSYVTDVLRTPEDQVALIMRYAKSEKLDVQFKATDFAVVGADGHYVWQMTWSILLSKGYQINPPMAAKVLTDYVKDGISKKGQTIMQSAHFAGKCFDIGGYDAADPTVTNEQAVMELAMRKQIGVKDIVVERKNNCVHVSVV